jgi:hypothetical protein
VRVEGVYNLLFDGMEHGRFKYNNAALRSRWGRRFRLPTSPNWIHSPL